MISTFAGLLLLGAAQVPPPMRMLLAATPSPPPPSKNRSARAQADLASLIDDKDYPAAALRNYEEGIVGFRLQIGVDGKVTSCKIIQSSGSAALDLATCKLLSARARFTPARDRRGKPTTDTHQARIIWRIMDSSLPAVEAMFHAVTLRATAEGAATCSFVINDQPSRAEACPKDLAAQMAARARAEGK